VFAQQKTITGKVTDESGGSLPNVTVLVKDGRNQAQTDRQGRYRIEASLGDVLIFRYVGFSSEERTVGDNTVINVTMLQQASGLDEVVVTAYGVDREKKSLGYSTVEVDGAEVAQTQREGFFSGLQGRVPGLSINSTNGAPGSSAQIVLRGFVSLSGDNNALIVVDGVPVDNSILSEGDLVTNSPNRDQDYSNRGLDINPEDIESYTILKGPEATAMFGNQGASGAILITTKRSAGGRGLITYNNSFRWETLNRWPERQTVYGPGQNGVFSGTTSIFQGPKFPEGTPMFDNFDLFFRTGMAHKHNLVFEGGSNRFTYRWSNEFTDNKGVIPNTRYTRLSSRLGATAEISEKLSLNTSFNYVKSDNDKARRGPQGYMVTLMRFSPSSDVRNWIDEYGNRVTSIGTIYSEYDNPFWDVYRNTTWDKVDRLLGSTNLTYKPTDWLSVTGILGVDFSQTHGESVYHGQSYRGSGSAGNETGGRFVGYDRLGRILTGSLTARSRHQFGKYSATFVLGGNFDDYNYQTNSQSGERFFDPDFYSINNTLPSTQRARYVLNRYRNVGFFGQAVLGYESLLYLTLSGRVDGASRLMPNNPFFAYPAGSIAFNFTELDFFKDRVPWLEDGKLRSSISLTGKQPWRTYATGSNLEPVSSSGGGFAYSYYGGNPDLSVETTRDFEYGFEFSLFKRRVTADFTSYRRLSIDQIILPRLSYGSGFVLRMMNGGDVENKGVEIQLKGNPIRKANVSWDVTVNYTRNRGTVLSVADQLPEYYESDTWILGGVRSGTHPGYSIGALSGTRFERNDNGDILINPANGLPIMGDGTYHPIGDRIPKYTVGLVNNFRYKDFSLSFLWDLRYGGDVLNGLEYEMYTRGISTKTLNREEPRIINGVIRDGLENTANPTRNAIAVTPYFNSLYYTTNVEPEMFIERNIKALRLRDITLSYVLPARLVSRVVPRGNLSGFVTVTDLVLITNYTGLDPESNSNNPSVGGIGGYGIDYGNIGRPIGFNIGLRLRL